MISEGVASRDVYRPDIDGLRALAVLAVLIFHGFPQLMPGGFVGVDVFFVLSGYLITGILLREFDAGTFSLSVFYARRVRRIFPALLPVLLFSYLVGWEILTAVEYDELGVNIRAAAGFYSNIALWLQSGYFDSKASLKPLLHLWSLGVEEQFYLVWPLLLAVSFKFQCRGRVWLAFALGSFVVGIITLRYSSAAAFFLPFGRFWEMVAGALLASSLQKKDQFSHLVGRHAGVLSIVGLLLLVVALFWLDESRDFPGFWALLPVLGAVLLLAAGPEAVVNRTLLSRRWMIGLGLISYPLYLWHWPLLSFAYILAGKEPAGWIRSGLLLLAGGLAWLTYAQLERRVRWLRARAVVPVLLLLMALLGFLGHNLHVREGLDFRYTSLIKLSPDHVRDLELWENKGFYPTGDCDPGFDYPEAHLCALTVPGRAPDTVVLGDSHAYAAYWGISKSLGAEGRNVLLVGSGGGCLPVLDQKKESCRDRSNHQIDWILHSSSIDTVLIAHRNWIRSSSDDSDVRAFEAALDETVKAMLGAGKRVVYLFSVPEARVNPRLCIGDLPMGRKLDRTDCAFPLARELEQQQRYRTVIEVVKARNPGLELFDPAPVLCPAGQCRLDVSSTLLWTDDNHLSESASYLQGQALVRTLAFR